MKPSLNILISTINEGIDKVSDIILPQRNDVVYIISHQYTEEKYKTTPIDLIKRDDVIISQIQGKGVTKSRNNAIKISNAEISLFSDDDVKYTNEYFDKIIHYFNTDTSLDVALFKIKTPDGSPEYKDYPENEIRSIKKLPFSVGTIEIAFRTDRLKEAKVLFDERFGAGQPLIIGSDESIFILDCIKRKLNVCYFPEYIVEHPVESAIQLLPKFHIKRVSVVGAYDARTSGLMAIPKAFYYTFRLLPELRQNGKSAIQYLKERLSAAIYILKSNR